MKWSPEKHYKIDEHIHSGDYADIYRAHWGSSSVAIKMARVDLDPGDTHIAKALIQREAAALSAIGSHPHIVELFNANTAQVVSGRNVVNTPFIAIAYASTDVETMIRNSQRGRLTPWKSFKIAKSVASALDQVHQTHVHRDVKPDNILVEKNGAVLLADFGMAIPRVREDGFIPPHPIAELTRFQQGWQTPQGVFQGIPVFASPELLIRLLPDQENTSHVHTPSSYIYALGVTLYNMLTGELPFPIETSSDVDDLTAARSILTAHDTGTVKPLEEALKEETTPVHLALQEPVSSALAKEPSQRPTALDFNTQLSEAFERGKRTKIRRKTYNSSRPKKKR